MTDFDELAAGLRAWAARMDAHDRAAVGLLIAHRRWLERDDFFAAAIGQSHGETYVSWRRARDFCDSGAYGSDSERAVLRAACLIGSDQLRFSVLDDVNAALVAAAFAVALGVEAAGRG